MLYVVFFNSIPKLQNPIGVTFFGIWRLWVIYLHDYFHTTVNPNLLGLPHLILLLLSLSYLCLTALGRRRRPIFYRWCHLLYRFRRFSSFPCWLSDVVLPLDSGSSSTSSSLSALMGFPSFSLLYYSRPFLVFAVFLFYFLSEVCFLEVSIRLYWNNCLFRYYQTEN